MRVNVLNHGFVELVDVMGDDDAVVDAARVSISGENVKPVSENRALIRYLMRHRHCYTPEMEVLTISGWKRWDECEAIEQFLVPDPETRKYRVEELQTECFDADETLCCFKSARMSYRVTPDHRMYFRGKYQDSFDIVRACNMPQWGHFDPSRGYTLGDLPIGREYDEWAFIGFYLGDGSYASTNRVTFHLRKDRKKTFLADLVQRLGLTVEAAPSATYDDAVVYTLETPALLRAALGAGLSHRAKDKHLPVLPAKSVSALKGLYDGLVASDGHFNEDRKRVEFSSTSPRLRRDFETVATFLGLTVTSSGTTVRAHLNGRTTLEARKQYFYAEHYSGKVYCATTSTGLLMVRGGGQTFGFVCGNTTPFEMVEFKFRCKMPIFVARQWIRHRTANVNEMSARYSQLPAEWYVPEPERVCRQSQNNKQGSGAVFDENDGKVFAADMNTEAKALFDSYDAYLKDGLARELARINLPLSAYTQWVWKIDLHNLFHFLALRLHSHAQYEIKVYADAMAEMVKEKCPLSYEAFEDYRLNGMFLTAQDVQALATMIAASNLDETMHDLKGTFKTEREEKEFIDKLMRLV